jgi:hypothetical protein
LKFFLNIIGTELVGGDGDDLAEFPSCWALTSYEDDDESDRFSKQQKWFLKLKKNKNPNVDGR